MKRTIMIVALVAAVGIGAYFLIGKAGASEKGIGPTDGVKSIADQIRFINAHPTARAMGIFSPAGDGSFVVSGNDPRAIPVNDAKGNPVSYGQVGQHINRADGMYMASSSLGGQGSGAYNSAKEIRVRDASNAEHTQVTQTVSGGGGFFGFIGDAYNGVVDAANTVSNAVTGAQAIGEQVGSAFGA